MTIGENIKKYRKQKGMTQRELADAIGVSVQAISKWECGATPDISQILPLAGALGASANELLGSAHHYEQLREKWYEMRNQYGEGSVELIEYEKSVLAEYPNDDYFGFALACEWDIRADECENENERLAYYRQAKKQYEENLKRKPDCEVNRSQLVCVCMKMGLKEEAMQYALQSSRKDVLLNHVYRGRELQEHKQRMIDRHLRHLIMEIRRSDNIESFRIGQNILRAVFPDGNCQRYYRHMVILGVHIAGKCMENQQHDEAMEALWDVVEIIRDERRNMDKDHFTSPLLNTLDIYRDWRDTLDGEERVIHVARDGHESYLQAVLTENGLFYPGLSKREDFKRLLSEVDKMVQDLKGGA